MFRMRFCLERGQTRVSTVSQCYGRRRVPYLGLNSNCSRNWLNMLGVALLSLENKAYQVRDKSGENVANESWDNSVGRYEYLITMIISGV